MSLHAHLYSPGESIHRIMYDVNLTPVICSLFADLVTDSLTEYSYDAELAGLSYQFASHNLGIYVALSGYNDKLDVLAKVVLEKARNLVISPERLHVIKSSVSP